MNQSHLLLSILLLTSLCVTAQNDNSMIFVPTSQPSFQVDYASPTADKPQSKLWYMENSWWAILPRSSGPSLWQRTEEGWKEHTNVTKSLAGIPGRADVWADDRQVTAVGITDLKKTNHSLSVFQLERKDGFSEICWEATILTKLFPPSPDDYIETATIIRDSKGKWWIAAVAGTKVCVWSSSPGGEKWTPPLVLAQRIDNDDICTITPLPDNKIGVIWSDQIREAILIREHEDGNPEKLWDQEDVIEIGNKTADDHLNTSLSKNGTLWVATKNSVDLVGKPQFVLRERSFTGKWTNMPYVIKGKMQWQSRPIVVATEDNSIVFSAYGGNDRAVPSLVNPVIICGVINTCNPAILDNPQVIISPDSIYKSNVQNVTGPRHPFPQGVPWIILASDPEGRVYEADLRKLIPPK